MDYADLTDWTVLGGPIIGFQFIGDDGDGDDRDPDNLSMSVIVGDVCKPKFYGALKLNLLLGERREVRFDWQGSDADHYSACLSHGLFHVQNSGALKWVTVNGNKATFYPAFQDVYPSLSYLSLHYGGKTRLLRLLIGSLYHIPALPEILQFPLI